MLQLLQVAANVGILAGLVLVGFQMKQNSDLLRTQIIYLESERQLQIENTMMGEDPASVWAKSFTDLQELDLREQRVLEAYYFAQTEQWRATYRLAEQGLLDDEWKYRVDIDAHYLLNNPYGRAYWGNTKNSMPEELAQYVDTILDDNPNNFSATSYLQDIMQEALNSSTLEDSK